MTITGPTCTQTPMHGGGASSKGERFIRWRGHSSIIGVYLARRRGGFHSIYGTYPIDGNRDKNSDHGRNRSKPKRLPS